VAAKLLVDERNTIIQTGCRGVLVGKEAMRKLYLTAAKAAGGRALSGIGVGLAFALGLVFSGVAADSASAATVFHNSATSDGPFQTAAGGTLAEQDFEGFANGSALPSFLIGTTLVSISYAGPSGGTTGEIFTSGEFTTPGEINHQALLNRDASNTAHEYMVLTFSGPDKVVGFGTWVFDNNTGSAESFTLTANAQTSPVLDGNPGLEHGIDGFLAVTDGDGIAQVIIHKISVGNGIYFELDHMQIATESAVPLPAALPLFATGLGVAGLAGWRRKKKTHAAA
jgi:hypothetical protein